MPRDYAGWKKIAKMQDRPDLYVLNQFYHATKQFKNDPNSKASETVMNIAMDCVKRYLGEEDGRYEDI